jgi:hypothetical protein
MIYSLMMYLAVNIKLLFIYESTFNNYYITHYNNSLYVNDYVVELFKNKLG